MPVPNLTFETEGFFDCHSCGQCCRTQWTIRVEDSKADRLRRDGPEVPLVQDSGGSWLTAQVDGACGFLSTTNLCSIHQTNGPEMKPTTCLLFPFVLPPIPNGLQVGLSHYCPSVRQKLGRPIEQHREWLEDILTRSEPGLRTPRNSVVKVSGKHTVGWTGYEFLESEIVSRLSKDQPSAVFLALTEALVNNLDHWQRLDPQELFAEASRARLEHGRVIAQQLAQQLGPRLSSTPDLFDTKPYLISLVQRKFLTKGQDLLSQLATLAVISILLEREPDSEACIESLELLVTHQASFELELGELLARG